MSDTLQASLIAAITSAPTLEALEVIRIDALGKSGQITAQLKQLGGLSPEARKERGAELNRIKEAVTAALEARKTALEAEALDRQLAAEAVDVTLPSRPAPQGSLHPITRTIDELTQIFGQMGFDLAVGPDIEDDFHNFTALNIPPEHPARQMHDTFYLCGETAPGHPAVLRTHTSPVQIRVMQGGKPPFRVIAPGRTYRSDSDQTHTPMFHQIEGFVVGRDIHMGHLKGTLQAFLEAFFGVENLPVRFRPSFFPFTEPSAEVDIGCNRKGERIEIGAGADWLEILGCGMIHRKVLENCGLDPDEWQGFAFGMGIERLAMLKYGIPDLRAFFAGDLRWLRHYGFAA